MKYCCQKNPFIRTMIKNGVKSSMLELLTILLLLIIWKKWKLYQWFKGKIKLSPLMNCEHLFTVLLLWLWEMCSDCSSAHACRPQVILWLCFLTLSLFWHKTAAFFWGLAQERVHESHILSISVSCALMTMQNYCTAVNMYNLKI